MFSGRDIQAKNVREETGLLDSKMKDYSFENEHRLDIQNRQVVGLQPEGPRTEPKRLRNSHWKKYVGEDFNLRK